MLTRSEFLHFVFIPFYQSVYILSSVGQSNQVPLTISAVLSSINKNNSRRCKITIFNLKNQNSYNTN